MSFRLVSKSVTLNDLERRNGRYYSRSRIASAIAEDCYILVVLFIFLLQSPAIAIAIARDCYILVVLFINFFLFFFRPPNF